jgi:stage II sporulation protein D
LIEGVGRVARWHPEGSGPWQVGSQRVRGRIAVRAREGRIQVLNRVALEDYVASTVGGEMAPSWPEEALRAQAVATRTYVLHEAAKRRNADWDVRATATSQVYGGMRAETRETRAAARATRGEVLTYGGELILAVFHSTAGGRTATAGEVWGEDRPYLRVVDVEDEDDAPHTYWRAELKRPDLEAALALAGISVGRIEKVAVADRSESGRVRRLSVKGVGGRASLRGRDLRSLLGNLELRSTLFEIREIDGGYAFVGSGYGHGVGMSQWGARSMALRGQSYRRILATFYPGARLERWRAGRIALALDGLVGDLASLTSEAHHPRRVEGDRQ